MLSKHRYPLARSQWTFSLVGALPPSQATILPCLVPRDWFLILLPTCEKRLGIFQWIAFTRLEDNLLFSEILSLFFQNSWFSRSKPTKVHKPHRRQTFQSPLKERVTMMLTKRGGRGIFDAKNFTHVNLIPPVRILVLIRTRIETIVSFFTVKSFAVRWREYY